ncbi:MAG: hypothetical protein FWC34_07740 [Bacteroidetes bacterium]|nr:hypothetical protein [Bacteroidota bacterium]MCL2302516.1 hypothetical protein [Lentimicrobiaceae bacterium]
MKRNLFSLLAILVFVIVCIVLNSKLKVFSKPENVIQHDIYWYYQYLPATFIHKDITLKFVDTSSCDMVWHLYLRYSLPNGNHVMKMSMGNAMMYAPAFFIADALAKPLGYERSGYSKPYTVAIALISLLYVVLGFFVLRKLLLFYFSDAVTAISIFIVGLCTNLLFYTTVEAAMTHAFSFFLFACFIYLTKVWFDSPKWKYSISLGIVFGLISLIRPTNALIVLVFLLYGIKEKNDIKRQFFIFIKQYKQILVIALFSLIVWMPQLIYWKYITGSWLFWSYTDNEGFFFSNPHIIQFLFGFRKGWLIYTPVMIFSILGFYFVWKHYREYFFSILLFLLINIYVLSSWWCWWFGGSFGMRALVESYALLIIPLAAFLKALSKFKLYIKIPVIILIVLFSCLSIFNFVKFRHDTIHYASMTREAYFKYFFSLQPDDGYWILLDNVDYELARKGIYKSLEKSSQPH